MTAVNDADREPLRNSPAPRVFAAFCVAATHSGAGKTTVTLGLLAALRRRGLTVQPFKCGPDYIDAGHHRRACGTASRNLDTWMMGEPAVRSSFARAAGADVAVVEGVMGLFDGASADRLEGSTAHVARLLALPVLLVVDARAMARSIAALVKGFSEFESGVRVAGVIANNVSGENHARILRDALSSAGLPPLLGTLPRTPAWRLPERHLGLIADTESGVDETWFDALAEGIEKHVAVDGILRLCRAERPTAPDRSPPAGGPGRRRVRLGLALDEAFHFYYEDNLDLLREVGAELVPFSPVHDTRLPADLDGLYIGGGFPEMFADALSANAGMRESIRAFDAAGGSIYAECGGLMYLGRTLTDREGRLRTLCGVLPLHTQMQNRLQRLGYVEATALEDGPMGPRGTVVRGHEFHWSSVVRQDAPMPAAWSARSLRRNEAEPCGFRVGNVWASYLHVHFASRPDSARNWTESLAAKRTMT